MTTTKKLCVFRRTSDYRGDHAADVLLVHELRPGETVDELAARLLLENSDVIEIRLVIKDRP